MATWPESSVPKGTSGCKRSIPLRAGKKGSSSFLKKRTEKLLSVAPGVEFNRAAQGRPKRTKVFLVLFFQKKNCFLACFT
jgi:hypothetical protein